METPAEDRARHLAYVKDLFERIPFNRVLGIQVRELSAERVLFCVPFREELIGDSQRPALHGGVLSATADAAGGAAVWAAIGPADRVSTIDLRIDYLRPARPEDIHVEATVLRVGNRVGVASIRVFHPSSPDEIVADCKGVYSVKRSEDR